MAPSPSYLPTALPKSVHSRATHDDGGAVATYGRSQQVRPSRVGQRSQRTATLPRHVAMAPSPSYLPTALPKSVNSRATHDDEGAVATANPQMQSQIANRKIVNSQLPARPLPSTSLHFYTAKAISHDGEGAVATYGRSQQVRPSRVGQRSQRTATLPRHVAMAPSPSYLPTALPKSVNSRVMCDDEGAVATANPQMQS